jgi:hypothetical protein
MVIVHCDRGYNIGFVNRELDSQELFQLSNGQYKPKKILSELPHEDNKICEMLLSKITSENHALEECWAHCQGRRIGALTDILGAEFQFDRKKLTIFIKFYQNVSVCRLVRKLYDTFKMRVKVLEVDSVDVMEQRAKRYLELSKLNVPLMELFDRSVFVPKPLPLPTPETAASSYSPPPSAVPALAAPVQNKSKQSSTQCKKKNTPHQMYPVVTVGSYESYLQGYTIYSPQSTVAPLPHHAHGRNFPQHHKDYSTSSYGHSSHSHNQSHPPRYPQQYAPYAPPLPSAPAPRRNSPVDYASYRSYHSSSSSNGTYLPTPTCSKPLAIQQQRTHLPPTHASSHYDYHEDSSGNSHAFSRGINLDDNNVHRHWSSDFSAPYRAPAVTMPTRQGRLPVTSNIAAPLPFTFFEEEKKFYYDQRISPLTTEGDNDEDDDDNAIQSLIASLTLPKDSFSASSMPMFDTIASSSGDSNYQRTYY